MAALSPLRFFAALARSALQFALSLARCLTLQGAAPCYRIDSLCECGRPHDTLSCLFFSALWLRQSQSMLTQVQQTNDIDLTCYKTLPTKSVTCLQVEPMSLEWPVAPSAGSDMTNIQKTLFQLSHIYVGGAMLFNHLKYNEVVWIGTRVSIFLMAVFVVLPGILEVLLDLGLPHKIPGNRNITTSADISKTTTSSAFKKDMGRTNFFMLSKCSHHVSNSLVRLYQTMQIQVVQPCAFIKT